MDRIESLQNAITKFATQYVDDDLELQREFDAAIIEHLHLFRLLLVDEIGTSHPYQHKTEESPSRKFNWRKEGF